MLLVSNPTLLPETDRDRLVPREHRAARGAEIECNTYQLVIHSDDADYESTTPHHRD